MEINQQKTSSGGKRWLRGVIAVYSAFALGTLAVVGFTFTQKVELITDRHYQEGVAYQSKIDNSKRAAGLAEPIRWGISSDGKYFEIVYPAFMLKAGISGTILFLRPSSSSLDKKFSVAVDAAGVQRIAISEFAQGLWRISADIQSGGAGYYKETDIMFR